MPQTQNSKSQVWTEVPRIKSSFQEKVTLCQPPNWIKVLDNTLPLSSVQLASQQPKKAKWRLRMAISLIQSNSITSFHITKVLECRCSNIQSCFKAMFLNNRARKNWTNNSNSNQFRIRKWSQEATLPLRQQAPCKVVSSSVRMFPRRISPPFAQCSKWTALRSVRTASRLNWSARKKSKRRTTLFDSRTLSHQSVIIS